MAAAARRLEEAGVGRESRPASEEFGRAPDRRHDPDRRPVRQHPGAVLTARRWTNRPARDQPYGTRVRHQRRWAPEPRGAAGHRRRRRAALLRRTARLSTAHSMRLIPRDDRPAAEPRPRLDGCVSSASKPGATTASRSRPSRRLRPSSHLMIEVETLRRRRPGHGPLPAQRRTLGVDVGPARQRLHGLVLPAHAGRLSTSEYGTGGLVLDETKWVARQTTAHSLWGQPFRHAARTEQAMTSDDSP